MEHGDQKSNRKMVLISMTTCKSTPVKEREFADRCRYCGRPTWSLRRCCVPCKWNGRRGPGVFPGIRYGVSLQALVSIGFWLLHVLTASLTVVIISWICFQPAGRSDWIVAVTQVVVGPAFVAVSLCRGILPFGFTSGSLPIATLIVVAAAVSCFLCVLSLSKRRCNASRKEPPA